MRGSGRGKLGKTYLKYFILKTRYFTMMKPGIVIASREISHFRYIGK